MESPVDLAKKIAETLNWKLVAVQETFDINEDKQGFFIVKLNPKKFLDTPDFKAICALTRDLGGDGGYVKATRSWKVAGPVTKKSSEKTALKQGIDSQPTYKEPRNAIPTTPYALLPVQSLLSMPFQSRKIADDSELGELAENIKTYGLLQPIIVRQKTNGLYEIVAGERRVNAAKKAGLIEVPALVKVFSDEEAAIIQLTENIQRKDLSEEEKTRALGELAKKTGWKAQQIADHLKRSYQWVVKYLPDDFKDKAAIERGIAGGQATAEGYRESQDTSLRRREESQETRQQTVPTVPSVPCAYCGEPVEKPLHLAGKFYHPDCAEQVQAEKDAGVLPEDHVGPFETTEQTEEEAEPEKASNATQIGEFDCTKCGQHFLIDHLANGQHKLRLVRSGD